MKSEKENVIGICNKCNKNILSTSLYTEYKDNMYHLSCLNYMHRDGIIEADSDE